MKFFCLLLENQLATVSLTPLSVETVDYVTNFRDIDFQKSVTLCQDVGSAY
jgi:hypothetical protein